MDFWLLIQTLNFCNSETVDFRNTSAPSNASTSDFGILYSPRAPSVIITTESASTASTFPTSALSLDLTFLWTILSQSNTGGSDNFLFHLYVGFEIYKVAIYGFSFSTWLNYFLRGRVRLLDDKLKHIGLNSKQQQHDHAFLKADLSTSRLFRIRSSV